MGEATVVQRILNNANPKIASGLWGTVNNATELMRVGSMIENDLASMKNFWTKVNIKSNQIKLYL